MMRSLFVSLLFGLFLVGCGGSATDPVDPPAVSSAELSAQVVGGNLLGVGFESTGVGASQAISGEINATTFSDGIIPIFAPGSTTLSIGEIELGTIDFEADAASTFPTIDVTSTAQLANTSAAVTPETVLVITLSDLIGDTLDSEAATNLVALLFLLDDDNDLSTGVTIDTATLTLLAGLAEGTAPLNLDQPLADFLADSATLAILSAAGVSEAEVASFDVVAIENFVNDALVLGSFVTIAFPSIGTAVGNEAITVSGTVNDISGSIAEGALVVVGLDTGSPLSVAPEADGNWSALLTGLVPDADNLISADFTDSTGATVSTSSTLPQISALATPLSNPLSITVTADGSQALVVDIDLNAVIAVDLSTGNRTVLSDAGEGTGPGFLFPISITLTADGSQALVLDAGLDAVIAVDLTPGPNLGNREVLSDAGEGAGPGLSAPESITVTADGSQALVVDSGLDALIAVDLATGDRTVLSDAGEGTGPAFIDPQSITVTADGSQALVAEAGSGSQAVIAVDLTPGPNLGNREVLSDAGEGTGPGFLFPISITLTADGSQALVLDAGLAAVIVVDLSTGNREVLSDAGMGTGPGFFSPQSITLTADGSRALVVNGLVDVIEVDLANGNRTEMLAPSLGEGPGFDSLESITVTKDGSQALVVDESLDAVIAVDLATGNRTVLSDAADSTNGNAEVGTGPGFGAPESITLTEDGSQALVLDGGLDAVIAVDLSTGDRTVLSDAGEGAGPAFFTPQSITLTEDGSQALVVDGGLDAVIAVSLNTGDRTVLSGVFFGVGTGPGFRDPQSITVTSDGAQALVVDSGLDAVIAVDLETGNREVLSDVFDDETDPDNPVEVGTGPGFSVPQSITLTADGSQALVVDTSFGGVVSGLDAVIAVDLSTGDREVLSDAVDSTNGDAEVGIGPGFSDPRSITVTVDGSQALVVDNDLDAVFVIDLVSGDRLLLSVQP